MSQFPADLRYAPTHEWVREEADGTITVGITDHAQDELGDIVFLELPQVGRRLTGGEPCAVIESVKTASDLHAPLAGEVVAVNDAVTDSPERVNEAPYEAWLFRIRPDALDLSGLLDADGYRREIGA